ncbi:hypothetical protein D1174_04315 [Enterobacter cloacae]|uniref:hypothetical protein n=1 Tax=Enterobacter cloacae complex TaxID=354276 RepID=UPI00122EDF2F|nr:MULTISPECIES: hypothetical protein [Enterobacter cloacae complex]KAA3579271.1 hypothetical protein D1177_01380 [Enterobacter cloacae]KAA3581271.1 hypothetical protein D1176_05165 [Enterobacter cloacae]KAA3594533.1 hypothetical protein D1175_05155 [Enterobacter cloacae]KAA3595384.1 hypothetical protein D1174_04315 [Enterobacter cloacae]MCK6893382.1 hypothetical protein [Enterobacter kobei]
MNQDALIIAKSILELKQDNDLIKDYLFPFFISFFSALLGAGVAYYFNKRQESFRIERERFDLANKIISDVLSGLHCLVSVKSNYIGIRGKEPFQRAFEVPIMIMNEKLLEIDISKYYFIGRKQTCNFTFKQRVAQWINYKVIGLQPFIPDNVEIGKSWRNLLRLSACISNYNYISAIIDKRNLIDEDIKKDIQSACVRFGINPREVSGEFILENVSQAKLIPYIHITEMLIALLDHVLREMDSFVSEFPEIAESNIEMKMIGPKAKVARIENDRPAYLASLIPIRQPDFNKLSLIIGKDLDETKRTYTFSDWY